MFLNLVAMDLGTLALSFGIVAGLLVLLSLTFKPSTAKLTILMRSLNLGGCIFFVANGVVLLLEGQISGLSLIIPNGALAIVDAYYLVRSIIDAKNEAHPAAVETVATVAEPEAPASEE